MTVQWIKPKSQKPAPLGVVESITKRGAASFRVIRTATAQQVTSIPVAELPIVIRNLKVDWKKPNSNSPLPSVAEEKLPTRGSVNWAGPKSQKPVPAEPTEIIPQRGASDWNTIVTEPTIEMPVAKNLVHEHVRHNVTKILKKFMSR